MDKSDVELGLTLVIQCLLMSVRRTFLKQVRVLVQGCVVQSFVGQCRIISDENYEMAF